MDGVTYYGTQIEHLDNKTLNKAAESAKKNLERAVKFERHCVSMDSLLGTNTADESEIDKATDIAVSIKEEIERRLRTKEGV